MSLRELVDHVESRAELPGPTVVFTVDDGYADFAQLAAPIFAGFDCPATTFLITDFVGQRQWNWWDRVAESFQRSPRTQLALRVAGRDQNVTLAPGPTRRQQANDFIESLKQVPDAERRRVVASIDRWLDVDLPETPPPEYAALSWATARRLESMGMEFAPHTVTHPVLSRVADSAVTAEIGGSWEVLQRECRNPAPIFGYPQGTSDAFGPREIAAVRACGLQGAVTFQPRYVEPRACTPEARYTIARFSLPDDLSSAVYVASGLAWERD